MCDGPKAPQQIGEFYVGQETSQGKVRAFAQLGETLVAIVKKDGELHAPPTQNPTAPTGAKPLQSSGELKVGQYTGYGVIAGFVEDRQPDATVKTSAIINAWNFAKNVVSDTFVEIPVPVLQQYEFRRACVVH